MRIPAVLKVLGLLLMLFSLSMLPPIAVSWISHDSVEYTYFIAFMITLLVGFAIWLPLRNRDHELKTRDGFLVVVLFWVVLSLFGSLPLYIDFFPKLSFTDAFFESVSGLTTTGATVLSHLHALPTSLLYYRQQLHLLGGMGIIVLAVAILPMLGVGGMQLYRAETVGPIKTTKLRPRMAQTAKALWYIYALLVIMCGVCYWLAGMHPFDAIGESFSTLSTGGFATHDSSFSYYNSVPIDCIAIVFMLLGAINFALHYQFIKHRRLSIYLLDPEVKAYLIILLSVTVIISVTLLVYHEFHRGRTLINALFTTVSLGTTTGFTTTNFSAWPTFLPYLLMFVAIFGGCGGSTSGGIKIIRIMVMLAQGKRELQRLIHPRGILPVKMGKETVPENIVQAIWGFMAVFIVSFVILLLILLADNLNLATAFGALASCISNTGAGIAGVASNYEHLPAFSKWVLIFAMLFGRLEIFTLIVIFTPSYWRK